MHIDNIEKYVKNLIENHNGKVPIERKNIFKTKKVSTKLNSFIFTEKEIMDKLKSINEKLDIINLKLGITK